MKPYIFRLNYSLLTYCLTALLGVLLFFYSGADARYMYILLSLAFIFNISSSCFNALTFKKYHSVLWPFFFNIFLLLLFILFNGGIGNVSFFGSNTSAFTLFLITMGFNSHWYMLVESVTLSDFTFLLINVLLSFIIPSVGYSIGYLYTSKVKQNETSTCSNSN
ncbi:hypothetical protein [Myroides sp. DW712]|uniref:hypothetical protein n=1 Tax=Myroides sp. DW712 TaxID=3389800 RepID=UPI00397839BB